MAEDGGIFSYGKSGSIELSGTDIETVLSQQAPTRMRRGKSPTATDCLAESADDASQVQFQSQVSFCTTAPEKIIASQIMASDDQPKTSYKSAGVKKPSGGKNSSLKSMIDSDNDEDDLMACMY